MTIQREGVTKKESPFEMVREDRYRAHVWGLTFLDEGCHPV